MTEQNDNAIWICPADHKPCGVCVGVCKKNPALTGASIFDEKPREKGPQHA